MKLFSASAIMIAALAASAGHGQPSTGKPHLLFLDTEETCSKGDDLQTCRALTVQKYVGLGLKVTRKTETELNEWHKSARGRHDEADPYLKYIAFARAFEADVIGGVSYQSSKIEKGMPPRPEQFYTWAINLKAGRAMIAKFQNGDTRVIARPLPLRDFQPIYAPSPYDDNAWNIHQSLLPAYPIGNWGWAEPTKLSGYWAFVGIEFDRPGTRVHRVIGGLPADRVGIRAGDSITKLNGQPIESDDDFRAAMGRLGPGQTIDVTWQRGESTMLAIVEPINWYESNYERQLSFYGHRLPELNEKDYRGATVRLDQFKGKIVVLNFWATWCGPCRGELPFLEMMSDALPGDSYVWVNVSADDDEKAWRRYLTANALSGIQIRAPEWTDALAIGSFPTTYLLDRNGVLKGRIDGSKAASHVISVMMAESAEAAQRRPQAGR
jgi:thiol-disulfide isomerase/thioredoxin